MKGYSWQVIKQLKMMTVLILISCATNSSHEGNLPLNDGLNNVAMQISNEVETGSRIAILNFNSSSKELSEFVVDELSLCLIKIKKITIVERKELDIVRQEMNFQLSGDVGEESAKRIGAMLGADYVISGSLYSMAKAYRFRFVVINVESAIASTGSAFNVNKNDGDLAYFLNSGEKTIKDTHNPLVGTWELVEYGRTFEFQFNSDNTLLTNAWAGGAKGTYSIIDTKIYINIIGEHDEIDGLEIYTFIVSDSGKKLTLFNEEEGWSSNLTKVK